MNIGELANGGGHGRGNPPARRRPAAGGTRTLFGLGQQAGITGGKKYAIFSGFRSATNWMRAYYLLGTASAWHPGAICLRRRCDDVAAGLDGRAVQGASLRH